MNYAIRQVTAPTSYPVTTLEATTHTRIDADAVDTEFENIYIPAAVEAVEGLTGRQLITATYELTLPCLMQSRFELPKGRLQSVEYIKYYDSDNVQQTYAASNYMVNTASEPGIIDYTNSAERPSTYDRSDAVVIRYTCGYGDRSSVPPMLKLAVLMHVTHAFENRGDAMRTSRPFEMDVLANVCKPYRLGDEFVRYA